MGGPRRLDDVRWPQLVDDAPVVIVPIGSCEQHGPHLPLGTDSIIATEIASRAVAALDRCVLGPTLGVTASGEHQGFPGTLSIGNDAMELLVVELVRSADWAAGIVLVNGHGGNHAAVTAAVERSTYEGRRVLAWWPRPSTAVTPPAPSPDLHAGHVETSLMLAIDPTHVALDHARPGPTLDRAAIARVRNDGVRSVSPDGVLGDPTRASAETGRHLLDQLVTDLVSEITAWSDR